MPVRILIAEDDLVTLEAMTKLATIRGYEVVAVTNGADLISTAAKEKFDVIITDLAMPDLNGAAATKILRSQECTVPVIAITALSPHQVNLVQDMFAKVFHKPIYVNELFEYLESLLSG